eukprot:COSAG02_NODE_62379_length_266_cov_0.610778_1_plen_26_part_01
METTVLLIRSGRRVAMSLLCKLYDFF